jgi:hypothetical protein
MERRLGGVGADARRRAARAAEDIAATNDPAAWVGRLRILVGGGTPRP